MQTHPTTPFGRRPLSLPMVASQAATEAFRAKTDAAAKVVHKWRLFRALTEAKEPLGVTDRALSVLHALLSFHQETALSLPQADAQAGEGDSLSPGLIVFPSNKELSIRAHGMAPATLRRHLACLVEAGLIIRRDSPNGKRFARRGQGARSRTLSGSISRPSSRAPTRSNTSLSKCAPRTAPWPCCAKKSRWRGAISSR